MPQPPSEPIKLVIPNSLQMGWVESPAYFCVASETACDVATWHAKGLMETTPTHRFLQYAMEGHNVTQLPPTVWDNSFQYFVDVYVDNFIPVAIATSQQQLAHVASAVMKGIHDVFPAHPNPDDDPISQKKLKKGDG